MKPGQVIPFAMCMILVIWSLLPSSQETVEMTSLSSSPTTHPSTAPKDVYTVEDRIMLPPLEQTYSHLSPLERQKLLDYLKRENNSYSTQNGRSTTNFAPRYYDYSYRPNVGSHYVDGYYRGDGTYVSGHYKTNPDSSFWNNWSSKGNTNPYTGILGSKKPPSIFRQR